MSAEKTLSVDAVNSGLVCGANPADKVLAMGRFIVECYDSEGILRWREDNPNLVVNVGLQYMCGAALTSTSQITSWYIGLYGSGSTNNPAAGDTMVTHAGWTEVVAYSNATRPACTFVAATLANPSVATNSASPAAFNMNASTTVGGAFLTSSSTVGGATGTLFSASDFTTGDRAVLSGDTLNVTYTLSLAG